MTSRLGAQLGEWDAGSRVAASLADRIRMLLLDGRITVGERLPSERALAAELGRSRATITRAYDLLAEGGYLERMQGSGSRAALPVVHRLQPVAPTDDLVDLSIASVGSTPGLHAATVRALDRLAGLLGSPGYTLDGLRELRERIADRYTERGLPTTPEQIVVTMGAMHALTLALAALTKRGGTAIVEQPTFPHAMDALRRAGLRLAATPVEPGRDGAGGWDAHHLVGRVRELRPHVAYLIPDFHNPTGATMPDLERARVAAAARQAGTLVIVDETCAELDIDRAVAPRPFGAHAASGGLAPVHIGSLSKVAWGGMRVGWLRGTREQVQRVLAVRPSHDLGSPMLEQCIAIELLGDMPQLLAHTRERLAAERDAVEAGVAAHLPGAIAPHVDGGLSTWVDLGAPVSTRLSLAGREHGVILPPGPRFSSAGAFERFARIPITWEPDVTATAFARLGAAWRALGAGAAAAASEAYERTVV